MMGGKKPHGFTIFETMLFLAISGVLLATAISLISGKQQSTEFTQGIYQIQNQLESEISNVSTGYYQQIGDQNFSCSENGGHVAISSAITNAEGTNYGCQYIGEGIQFSPNGNNAEYTIFPIAGAESPTSPALVDAGPCAIMPGSTCDPVGGTGYDNSKTQTLPYGFTVGSVWFGTTPEANTAPSTLAFFTSEETYNTTDAAGRGVNVMPINTDFTSSNVQAAQNIYNGAGDSASYDTAEYDQPITICFNSRSLSQAADITIGDNDNPSNVSLVTQAGSCPKS
jgi:hypothetical protein